MPRDDAESLREYMIVRDASSLEEYLARFETTLSVMQTAEALERIAYELAIDAAREGVWYLETRFAPNLNTRGGLTPEQALEAAIKGLDRARRDCGIIASRARVRVANVAALVVDGDGAPCGGLPHQRSRWLRPGRRGARATQPRPTRRRSVMRGRTTCRARVTRARGTAPDRFARPCTRAARAGSATARGSSRTRISRIS